MGKKKSVVLMTLLTIVLIALCVITAFPAFTFPWGGGVKGWQPATELLDFGSDFNGGYYAYYYPEGVVSEAEFNDNYENFESADKQAEYKDSYVAHGGLYLAKDEKYGIFDDGEKEGLSAADVSEDFKTSIEKASKIVSDRYAKKGFSDFRVSVVDDYALKVELPYADASASTTITAFSNLGKLDLALGETALEELEDKEISDYIKGFSIGSQYDYSYISVKLTKAGKELMGKQKDGLSSTQTNDTATTLWVRVGGESIIPIYSDNVLSDNSVNCAYLENENKVQLETMVILLNSALENGESELSFRDASSEIRVREGGYGENAKTLFLVAMGLVTLFAIALPIVKYGRYGVTMAYSTVSYFVITVLCFAFITGAATFEITAATALVYMLGLALIGVMSARVYNAVKKEFDLGKTVASSVSLGYKKTLWTTVDVHVVLLIGAISMLFMTGSIQAVAWQAVICVVAAAFCNLLWTRVINYVHLSTVKDKYKYFRFVREDDDDE